jgi:hypothetical protein
MPIAKGSAAERRRPGAFRRIRLRVERLLICSPPSIRLTANVLLFVPQQQYASYMTAGKKQGRTGPDDGQAIRIDPFRPASESAAQI